MRAWIGILLIAGVVGAVTFRMTINAIPEERMASAMNGIIVQAGGANRMYHGDLPDETARTVVKPSPDLLYSACVFDLWLGPVRFAGHVPESYWSLSLFAENTDNFFVINDSAIEERRYDLVLVAPGQDPPPDVPAEHVVRAPGWRGIALVRMFIGDDTTLPTLKAIQREGNCTVVQ